MSDRLARCFARLKDEARAGLVTFITGGDPDPKTSSAILDGLPRAGADIVELGMPFSDPMADGPAIQRASQRALAAGATLDGVLDQAACFRAGDADTPLILMGYYNPILHKGDAAFITRAAEAGVDGLIIVDLPPEEDAGLRRLANDAGLHIIRLSTPTTDATRLPSVLEGASGFLYHVAVAGVTGGKGATSAEIARALSPIRRASDLPIAVGFGIKTADDVAAIAEHADGCVVGSAIVEQIRAGLDEDGRAGNSLVADVLEFVAGLAQGVRSKTLTKAG